VKPLPTNPSLEIVEIEASLEGSELWHRLLRRSASESGRLCHGDGGHEWGARRRRALMLPILEKRMAAVENALRPSRGSLPKKS
jgi:hypothetical protein